MLLLCANREEGKTSSTTRGYWKTTEKPYLCSVHFNDDCFEPGLILLLNYLKRRALTIKPDAIPTAFSIPVVLFYTYQREKLHKREVDRYSI